MTKSYAPHVLLIRDSIAAIERYRPSDKDAFLNSSLLQDAVLMRLQVIGENLAGIRRVDEARFAAIAPATWYQIIGLRNVISHGYEAINTERIWKIITEDIAELTASLFLLDGD